MLHIFEFLFCIGYNLFIGATNLPVSSCFCCVEEGLVRIIVAINLHNNIENQMFSKEFCRTSEIF